MATERQKEVYQAVKKVMKAHPNMSISDACAKAKIHQPYFYQVRSVVEGRGKHKAAAKVVSTAPVKVSKLTSVISATADAVDINVGIFQENGVTKSRLIVTGDVNKIRDVVSEVLKRFNSNG